MYVCAYVCTHSQDHNALNKGCCKRTFDNGVGADDADASSVDGSSPSSFCHVMSVHVCMGHPSVT